MAGVIFGIVAIGWLAYLLPFYLKQRGPSYRELADDAARIQGSMRVVYSSQPKGEDIDSNPELEVSTPLSRAADRYQIAVESHRAVRRRRLGLVISLLLTGAAIGLPFLIGTTNWWLWVLAPVILLGWLLASKLSLRMMNRRLDARLEALDSASEDATVAVNLAAIAAPAAPVNGMKDEFSVTIASPTQGLASLSDPIPVLPPTIAPRPVLPRSVRNVDLTPPGGSRKLPAFPQLSKFPQDALPFDVAEPAPKIPEISTKIAKDSSGDLPPADPAELAEISAVVEAALESEGAVVEAGARLEDTALD
jgi:hypothetical protein